MPHIHYIVGTIESYVVAWRNVPAQCLGFLFELNAHSMTSIICSSACLVVFLFTHSQVIRTPLLREGFELVKSKSLEVRVCV